MIWALVIRSLCSRWIAEVARKTWIRGFWANWIASQARSMSRSLHRARPQTDEPVTSAAMARTASKSPTEAIGKPGLDDVDPERGQRAGHLELLGHVHARARRLLAVAQGRVEDPDPVRRRTCDTGAVEFWGWDVLMDRLFPRFFVPVQVLTDRDVGSALPARPADGNPRPKKEAPRSTWRGGSRGFVGCIPVRSRRTLRYPPRPADKAKAG